MTDPVEAAIPDDDFDRQLTVADTDSAAAPLSRWPVTCTRSLSPANRPRDATA